MDEWRKKYLEATVRLELLYQESLRKYGDNQGQREAQSGSGRYSGETGEGTGEGPGRPTPEEPDSISDTGPGY
jgi:hypothetical protein